MADNLFKIKNGVKLKANSDTLTEAGGLKYDGSGNLVLRDGSAEKTVLDEDNSVTVTNKSIDADNNTISNIGTDELATGIDPAKLANGSVSATEFQYLDGLTSAIQTQLNNKAPSTGIDAANIANGSVSNTEFQYLDGLTSAIQTQLNNKAPSTGIDAANIANGSVSNTEFQYLDGLTSAIQTQLNNKAPSTGIDAANIANGSVSNTEFQYLDGVTSGLQSQLNDKASLTGTEDLSNKTFTDAITLEEQSGTPSTPASGDKKFYAKNDGKLYTLDDGGNESEVGSGAGGGRTLYINQDFEIGVTSLATYADAAGTSPVDADGGTPTVTVTAETSSPLIGSRSAKINKTAANLQGEGFVITSDTVDEAYQNSVHTVEFFWKPDANVVADALKLFVVHPTTGTVEALYFRNYLGDYTNSLPDDDSRVHRIVAEISPIDSTYKVVVHVAGTDSTAYTGLIDNIQAGPQRLVNVPFVTEWESFTPTGDFTNTTYTGRYRRIGDSAEIEIKGVLTGTPASASLNLDLPNGLTIDTAKITSTDADYTFGNGTGQIAADAGPSVFSVGYNSTTDVRIRYHTANTTNVELRGVTQALPATWASGDDFFVKFSVPISGWDAGATLGSTQVDQQTVKVRVYQDTPQSLANNTHETLDFNVVEKDEFNLYDTTGDYIEVPRDGWAYVHVASQVTGLAAGTGSTDVGIQLDSGAGFGFISLSQPNPIEQSSAGETVSIFKYFNKGDKIRGTQRQTNGASRDTTGSEFRNYMDFFMLPDYSVIGAIREKNLVQTKTLSADVTSNGAMSDLTFNNLTVGKWYEVTLTGNFLLPSQASLDNVNIDITHDGNVIGRISADMYNNSQGGTGASRFTTKKFKATATTLTFVASSVTSASILGNGTEGETHVQLEERNDLRETSKF